MSGSRKKVDQLVSAAAEGNVANVRAALADGALVNGRSKRHNGATALHRAAASAHAGVVEVLLEIDGIDANKPGTFGDTPLYAAADAGSLECTRLLLAANADVNKSTTHLWTPLHQAAWKGEDDIIAALCAAGAFVDDGGDTRAPLHLAALAGHVDSVVELINAGADTNLPDANGLTPIMVAGARDDIVDVLLQGDADPNVMSVEEQETALHMAVKRRWWESARVLLNAGAKVHLVDADGKTVLQLCNDDAPEDIKALLASADRNIGSKTKSAKRPRG